MKKMIVLGLTIAVVAFNSVSVFAADSKYPASDFEPSVIYIDKAAIPVDPVKNEVDPKYPASDFTPSIIFVDNQLANQEQDKFDPKYPAAYFKPKVIYP